MQTSPRYDKGDIIINFRDLTVHVLRRWRSIVVGVLIVTLLAGALQYLRDARSYKATLAAEQDQISTVQLEGLSLANANQVLQYQRLYQLQADYNREALLMQINPAAVPTRTLSYVVSGEMGFVTASLYQTHLGDLAVYKDIVTQLAMKNDPSHIMELVSVTVQHDSSTQELADHALVVVKIVAPTEDVAGAIAQQLKKQIQALRTTVTSALGAHTLTLVADSAKLAADSELKTVQQNSLNNGNTLRNNLKNAKDALTSQEKAYVEQMTAIDKVETDKNSPTPPSISVKMLIVGFAAGLLLMIGVYALGYVFGRKLKSREDFAERYGLFVFGCIADGQKKASATERLIRRLFFKKEHSISPEARLALAQQQLTLTLRDALADKENARVCVIGCTVGDTGDALAPFKDAAAKSGVALEGLANPLTDAAALERLNAADAAILAETVGASAYNDIYRELELCERLDRPVLGAFILE